jgi:hypothetical protein
METDIGYLAPDLDAHANRLGITKNMGKPSQFFLWYTLFSTMDFLAIALLKPPPLRPTLHAHYTDTFDTTNQLSLYIS